MRKLTSMSNVVLPLIFLVVGLAAGIAIGWFASRAHVTSVARAAGTEDPRALADELAQTKQQLEQMRQTATTAQRDLAAAQSSQQQLSEQVTYLRSQVDLAHKAEQQRVAAQHEAEQKRQEELATQREQYQEHLANESKRHQTELLQREQASAQENARVIKMLSPVADQLTKLQQRVTSIEEGRKRESGQMSEQLRSLSDTNNRLASQTDALSSVLTNNQARGHWGEISLRNLVEAAGMREHVDFDTQVVISTGVDSSSRPDMVIHLPGDKNIPVDSKTPFRAYQQAMQTDTSTKEGQETRAKLLADNVKEIKKHIDDLGKRDYSELFDNAPHFTIAFIPTEAVLSAALETDPDLLSYSFAHKVALCSPVSLWAVLQATAASWQQQSLSDDARELFQLCQQLYAGFRTLGTHVSRMGGQLEHTVKSYNALVGNLERTILPKARKLDEMDPKKIDQLSEITSDDGQVRHLTASELTEDAEVSVTPMHDNRTLNGKVQDDKVQDGTEEANHGE